MSIRSLRPAILAMATLFVGCTTAIRVNVMEPAPVNLGTSKRLSVVQTEGRRGARDFVIEELVRQSRSGGHFQTVDRSDEGITVKVVGRNVEVSGGKGDGQAPDEIGLRIDVLSWDAGQETRKYTEKDNKGNEVKREKTVYAGRVVLGVTAFNNQGKTFLAEKEIEASHDGEDRDSALNGAGRMAVTQLLGTITPRYVTKSIRMDDDDDMQKPIIKVAEQGNLARALEEMRAYATQNPNNPAAQYNYAVLLDATGQYQEALDTYTRAISMSAKDFYTDMKAECARRLANQQALSQ